MATHIMHVSDPWFDLIQSGAKTVEGRLNRGKAAIINSGDTIIFNDLAETRKFEKTVRAVIRYDTLEAYFEGESLSATLPGIGTVEEGIAVYRRFFRAETEAAHGVLAIRV